MDCGAVIEIHSRSVSGATLCGHIEYLTEQFAVSIGDDSWFSVLAEAGRLVRAVSDWAGGGSTGRLENCQVMRTSIVPG